MKRALVLMLLAVVVASASLSATTVLYVPMKKSIQLSDMVLVGHVLAMEPTYNADREIVTEVSLLVEESFKGFAQAGEIVKFHVWGGSLDGVHMETSGEARYRLGEKVLVQLEDIQGELHTLGLSFGKWNVYKEKDNSQWISRDLRDLNLVGVNETAVERMPLNQMREIASRHREN